MTFSFQPSAAALSWKSLCENMDNAMERAKALLMLSGKTTELQTSLTLTDSNQTLSDLTDQAQAARQEAYGKLAGAGAGIAVSFGTVAGTLKNLVGTQGTLANNSMKIEGLDVPKAPAQPLKTTSQDPSGIDFYPQHPGGNGAGRVDVDSKVPTAPAASKNATEENVSTAQARQQVWGKFWQEHGNNLGSFFNTGFQGGFGVQGAKWTEQQARDKALEAATAGINSVMGALQTMTAAAISSCGTAYDGTSGVFTTIIQVSAVRG